MYGESGEEKDRPNHEEVKLVHEVKQEVGSTAEARHNWKQRSVIFREGRWVDEQVLQQQSNEYYYQFEVK